MALMRRQSLVKFDAPLCETIVETPKPQGKEVLVRIERCGLCHSDLHIQDGYADLGGGKAMLDPIWKSFLAQIGNSQTGESNASRSHPLVPVDG